jgi:hypothetical protein
LAKRAARIVAIVGHFDAMARHRTQRRTWQFTGLDKDLDLAQQHGTEVLLTLAVTPQWASAHPDMKSGWQQPGLTSEPRSMDDWQAFVQREQPDTKGAFTHTKFGTNPT